MIRIFTGKPGGGKSYATLLSILDELEHGDRDIVTNVSLNLSELNAYFQRKGREFVDVFSRVRLIEKEDCREFWRFRGRFTVLPDSRLNGESAVSSLAGLVAGQPGVFYAIDEAHILFDSRNWQKSADSLTFYNSQHRKLRDELVFVTQFLGLIEKRVKGFAEMFHVYKNFGGLKFWTVLSMPRRMREFVYSVEPGPAGITPDSEIWRTLDPEKAACYDTTAGVGMVGGRKAEERKAKGFSLPWWSVGLALVALGAAFWFLPRLVMSRVSEGFSKMTSSASPPAVATPAAAEAPASPAPEVHGSISQAKGEPPKPQASAVSMTGFLRRGNRVTVILSDGRRLHGSDLLAVTDDKAVTLTGETYWRAAPSSRPLPVSSKRIGS